MNELTIPDFENEQQEAEWWDAHQQETTQAFERASATGQLGRSTVAKRAALPTTIQLYPDEIARVRQQAERRGLRYDT